jgi:hypothetical protein
MAVVDDLRKLAAEDVVYLTYRMLYTVGAPIPAVPSGAILTPTFVYRGRLRQALDGNWVFITSTGQNGVIAIMLGPAADSWSSMETPASGLQVTAGFESPAAPFGWEAKIGTLEPGDLST